MKNAYLRKIIDLTHSGRIKQYIYNICSQVLSIAININSKVSSTKILYKSFFILKKSELESIASTYLVVRLERVNNKIKVELCEYEYVYIGH